MSIPTADRKLLLALARASIRRCVAGDSDAGVPPAAAADGSALAERRGAFVTLHVRGALRGCIGSMLPDERLVDLVPELAVAAATRDSRFAPLETGELDDLAIEISILTPPEPVDSPDRIEIGRHGLVISRGPWHGVLLPQVATQQGWGREAFLSWTCRKAGLEPQAWREWADGRDADMVVEVFAADVFGEEELRAEKLPAGGSRPSD